MIPGSHVTLLKVIVPDVSVTVAFGLNSTVSPFAVYVPLFVNNVPLVAVKVSVGVLENVRIAPLLMVTDNTDSDASRVTLFPPVVAITTVSPVPGMPLPPVHPAVQVAPALQLPPEAVDVQVASDAICQERASVKTISLFNCFIVSLLDEGWGSAA